jgi:transposase
LTTGQAEKPETKQPRRPAHRPRRGLPRERVIYPELPVCPCCAGTTFRKLGADETESLERVPAQWKVVAHVREKFAWSKCIGTRPHGRRRIGIRVAAVAPTQSAIVETSSSTPSLA